MLAVPVMRECQQEDCFFHTPLEKSPISGTQVQLDRSSSGQRYFSGRERRCGQGPQIKPAIFAMSCCLWKRERDKDFAHTIYFTLISDFQRFAASYFGKTTERLPLEFKYHSKSVPPVTGYLLPIKIIHSTFDTSDYCSFLQC